MGVVTTAASVNPLGEVGPRPDGPLSIQQQQQVAQAARCARKVVGAAKVATFNGWSAGVFAVLSLPLAMFSATALVMGLGLAVVSWNEFRGRNRIRQFDPLAPRVLGWNQVGFLGLLVAYALWSIYAGLSGPDPYQAYIDSSPELQSMLGPLGQLHRTLTVAVYGGLIVLSVVFQGGNAVYYFSRGKYLQAYLTQTPAWIVDMQRRMAA